MCVIYQKFSESDINMLEVLMDNIFVFFWWTCFPTWLLNKKTKGSWTDPLISRSAITNGDHQKDDRQYHGQKRDKGTKYDLLKIEQHEPN
jgi:hypothetical protein